MTGSDEKAVKAVQRVLARAAGPISQTSILAILTLEEEIRINQGLVGALLSGQAEASLPPDFPTDKIAGASDFLFQTVTRG